MIAPESMVSLMGIMLIMAAWALWLLPVGSCSECQHCKLERLAKMREHEAAAGRVYGIPLCRSCGRHHERTEDHQR